MKRFRFRFENILSLKAVMEDLLGREFSSIRALLDREETRLQDLVDTYNKEAEGLVEKGELTSSEVEIYLNSLKRLKIEMEEGRRRLDLLRKRSEEKEKDLLQARKERKILEVLREKRLKEHIKSEVKQEQAILDEYSSNRFREGTK